MALAKRHNTMGARNPRGEKAAKHTTQAQNAFAPTIGLISNLLRFRSRYYRKETVLLLEFVAFVFWQVCFWRCLPFGLFAFGITCHMVCSLLALHAIRLIRFGFICLLRALAFGAVRLSDTQPSARPAPNS